MKKVIFAFFISIFLYSCKCEKEEVGKRIMSDRNKEYLIVQKRKIEYYNQNGDTVEFFFDGGKFLLVKQDSGGSDACQYTTIEKGEEHFNFSNSRGSIFLSETSENYIKIDGNTIFKSTFVGEFYDDNLENVTLNGFYFQNVLVFDNGNNEINKILYSKTNGIEFILFANGTWYKRVE